MVFQKRQLAFSQTATVEFCYLLFIAANYYFNLFLNIPYFLHRKKYFQFTVLFLAGILVTALLRVPLAMFLNRNLFIPGQPQPGFTTIFNNSLLNISSWTILVISIKLMLDRFRFQQHLDEVKKQKEQAELDFLNAQFNPHFLFNSLNSIYGHIDKQNATARNMLLTFSEMLRYQLYECNESLVPIDKEMSYIKNYVALQKVRKNEKLEVKLNIEEKIQGLMISPLLFIAFIENCFKYVGSGDDPGDFVNISFSKEDAFLKFNCENTKGIKTESKADQRGIGLSNAKRRLELLYPGKHEFTISENEHSFKINLKLKVG
jgi:LytS/YehU family sensor histidine kinase